MSHFDKGLFHKQELALWGQIAALRKSKLYRARCVHVMNDLASQAEFHLFEWANQTKAAQLVNQCIQCTLQFK